MTGLPPVSVVLPAYQAAATLPQTLDSVLAQTPPPAAVVVVDDGSTDGTAAVLAARAGRVTALRIENSGGPSRPRNIGLAGCGDGLVALFDADDLMLPGKLAAQAAVFAACPEVDLCFTDFRVIDAGGAVLQERFLDGYRDFRRLLRPCSLPDVGLLSGPDLHFALLRANFVGTSSVVARAPRLRAAGGFDETLRNGDDLDLWLRLAREGAVFAFLDRVGHAYRKVDGGVTARGWRRLPAVIAVRERQRPYVTDPARRRVLEDIILKAKLAYAWGLDRDGRHDEARRVYAQCNAARPTWAGIKGIVLATARSRLGGTSARS
ncbi:MAG: glycosyltransferase [bacterium]|nr:glycosyltransferase [bacterium]